MIQSFNAIDWKLFVKERNKIRENGIQIIIDENEIEFDDELTQDK